ncbi:hypothetical protein PsorP6_010440 [Peronosclerospora sorghi]|uniref:Uncharacterized protein n=1 Tax=Peronosclerospora sorghi TaxID=230839 RepID=A0ACC0VW22_9STRA|nr:hypothetical protein PsorP6_010440 [Peronosclerospora sorghi]
MDRERLEEMKTYLENVVAGRLPPNHQIICNIQTIFNLLPNLNVDELVRSMFVKTNDMHFELVDVVLYDSKRDSDMFFALATTCTGDLLVFIDPQYDCLHNLVNNKVKYKESEDVGFTERKDLAVIDKASKDKRSEKIP